MLSLKEALNDLTDKGVHRVPPDQVTSFAKCHKELEKKVVLPVLVNLMIVTDECDTTPQLLRYLPFDPLTNPFFRAFPHVTPSLRVKKSRILYLKLKNNFMSRFSNTKTARQSVQRSC